jgi:endonuclease/exonuclease/phosphatase family metal-dependent hydrolase
LSFNILYGGDEIDFSKVVEAIQKANPDVVGVQEAEGNIPKLATALGWKYFDTRLHLLSKYPVISSDAWGWYYALIEIQPGKVIAFSNVHLPSDPYGPDLGA